MRTSIRRIAAAALVSLGGMASAGEPQPQIDFTPGTGTTWNADWDGVGGRTYFLQWSLDLVTWMYASIVDFGITPDTVGVDTSSEAKFFVRLKYVDADWVSSKLEAENADFDNDGIPNWYEVENLFSDPLDGDSAGGDSDNGGLGDGLPDGWELYYFGDLVTANPTEALEGDGLTNKEKADLGLDPHVDYSDPGATQPAKFTYDLAGRLTGVTAPVAAATFTPDEEGNILGAQ